MKHVTLDRWLQLITRVSESANRKSASVIFQMLRLRYAGTQRHYHNLSHIDACFGLLDSVRNTAQDPDSIEIAIWFHDVIYDSHKSDNEQASAELAKESVAALGAPPGIIQTVYDLILATRHDSPPISSDAALLIDIDLAILGQPAAVFDQYERDIRREYDWVSEPEFRAGRARILQTFLDRKTIYNTDHFRNAFESAARQNLARSIAVLQG